MISFRLISSAKIDCIIPLLQVLDTRFSEDILRGRLEDRNDSVLTRRDNMTCTNNMADSSNITDFRSRIGVED